MRTLSGTYRLVPIEPLLPSIRRLHLSASAGLIRRHSSRAFSKRSAEAVLAGG